MAEPTIETKAPPCPGCGGTPGSTLACLACGRILEEPRDADHYARLGVPAVEPIDLADAEARYLRLSRLLHPDFQSSEDERTRRLALSHSATLNQAWRVLSNDQARAEYLLELRHPGALERQKTLSPEFLMEAMEVSEELEDAHATGCTETVDRIASLARGEIDERMDRVSQECAATIRRIAEEAHHPPGRPHGEDVDHDWDAEMLATLLHQARVYRRILRDAEKTR